MAKNKRLNILQELENDNAPVYLEYGVPLSTLPYQKIAEFHVDPDEDDTTVWNRAADRVENEFRKGKPAPFVVTRFGKERDVLEFYSPPD